MPKIDVLDFRGEIPKIAVRKLPPQAADQAVNLRISSGDLESWNTLSPVAATLRAGLVQSIFLYEDTHWFSWNGDVSAIKSPIAQDSYARVYYTGDGVPKVTSNLIATGGDPKPVNAYDLGVQAPSAPITIVVTPDAGADPDDFSDDETRFYVMTYVTEYGEEGPPGPVSAAVELASPSTDTVTLTLPIPTTNTENITHKRIYRTVTTGTSTEYFYVGDATLATTQLVDNITDAQLGGLLVTADFDAPPANMQGLVMGENGICAGFAGNEFIPSEAYLPYAYPVGYRQSVEHDIVAIAPTSTGFVVATKGYPHSFIGVSPDALSGQKLDVKQACVSGASLVDMGEFAIYASPDGLVAAGESRAELLTGDLFSRREWQAYKPETIHAYFYEDYYVGFYGDEAGTGSGVGGFLYNPGTQDFILLDFYATAGYNDLENDVLYLVVSGALNAWDGTLTPLTYRWRSKIFRGDTTAFTCAKVYTDDPGNVGFKMWVDGALALDLSSLASEAFRLPSVRGDEWQFELEGTAAVQRLSVDYALGEFE